MKIPRKLLTLLLLAIAVAAIGVAETFKSIAAKNLDLVRQDLLRVFGSDLDFDELDVSLFPRPGFSAKGIRVADDSRFAATPIVRTKELVLGVNLWNLLQGKITIDSLIFNEPELQVITNEAGMLNLTALTGRRKGLRSFPQMDAPPTERKANGVSFAVRQVRVIDGRVEYLDRAIQAPAELQVRNIDLTLRGFKPTEPMEVRLAAALSEGLNQDVRIDGTVSPQEGDGLWSQRPVDFALRFDSLYMPVIARAIAALRERFPRALNVTGPMALQVKVTGTFQRPKIDDFSLKMRLFGSSDYNAVASGSIAFAERRTWPTAELDGKVSVTSVNLDRLRTLPFVDQLVSTAVAAEGPVSVFSRFEGNWDTLRVGALVVANGAEIRFHDWLRKPAGVAAEIKTRISRRKHKILVHESELVVGAARTKFTGILETEPVPQLALQIDGKQNSLATWNQILAPSAIWATGGSAAWRIKVEKGFSPDDGQWNLRGEIKLAGADFTLRESGRRIEKLDGRVSLLGRQARFDDVVFRIGKSEFSMVAAADLVEPRVKFQFDSPRLHSADLPALDAAPFVLANVGGDGQMTWDEGRFPTMSGSFTASEGVFHRIDFRDLRTRLVWSAQGVSLEGLSAKIFRGTLRADGQWNAKDDKMRLPRLSWQADAIDANSMVTELMPAFKDRIDGRLSGHGRVDAAKGSGAASIDGGRLKDFNLVRQLLLGGSGASGSEEIIERWPAGFAGLVHDKDTAFDSLKANFVFEQQRIRTDDLVITTPEYTITGAGWAGLDRSTRWNGLLVLSPRLTQEIQREYRVLRYLLDRRGRLAISFRLEGTFPNVKVRLENRALAQLLRSGAAPRDDGSDGEGSEAPKPGKYWVPDALERFLNR